MTHLAQGFSERVNGPVTRGLGAPQRTAHSDRLAGDKTGVFGPGYFFIFVHHPDHVLAIGHDVGSGNILQRADISGDLPHPAAANLFLFAHGQVVGITNNAALAATERNVNHRALPGHPGSQRFDRIDGFLGVKADTALAGTA